MPRYSACFFQTMVGDSLCSSATAKAVNQLSRKKYVAVSPIIAKASVGALAMGAMSGWLAIVKNTEPAAQVATAGSAMLKSVRYRRRSFSASDCTKPFSATVSVAGAGPYNKTDENTNSSANDTLAGWPGILTLI